MDKKALPIPDLSKGAADLSAATETEHTLTEIWKSILGQQSIGLHENFMAVGGNSILVVKMHDEIAQRYPGIVGISDIFANPTISSLARYIETRRTGASVILMRDVPLKPEFYRNDAAKEERSHMFTDTDRLSLAVAKLKEEDKPLMQAVLMAAYCAALSSVLSLEKAELYCANETEYFALTADLRKLQSFAELTEHLAAAYPAAEKTSTPTIHLERKCGGVIPAFTLNCANESSYRKAADLYLSCKVTKQCFSASAESGKLSDAGIRTFLQRFKAILQAVFGIA